MTTRKMQFAIALVGMAACSEGAEGPPGPQGPAGPPGPSGADGISASETPGETSQPDAGPIQRTPSVVWQDATGKTIPVIGVSPSVHNNEVSRYSFLQYMGEDGIVWSLHTFTGDFYPAGRSEIAALAYDSPDCSGPAYVFVAVPARVTFQLEGDNNYRIYKDDAKPRLNASFASHRDTFSGPCVTTGVGTTFAALLTDTTTVNKPTTTLQLPLRPVLSVP